MEKDRVKSCSFCDGKARVIESPIGAIFFKCVECGCIVSFGMEKCNRHPEEAIEALNRGVVNRGRRRNAALN